MGCGLSGRVAGADHTRRHAGFGAPAGWHLDFVRS